MGILRQPLAAAEQQWGEFDTMMNKLAPNHLPLPEQVAQVRKFYAPVLEKRNAQAEVRKRDLDQLEQIEYELPHPLDYAVRSHPRPRPPGTQDLAGSTPLREEDWLVLSTIHSAKGCEWDAVYVIHAADGNIPSDMATGSEAEIEEERRLFYVALTRAKDFLEVIVPLRYYQKKHATGDRHTYAQPSRFLPDAIMHHFGEGEPGAEEDGGCDVGVEHQGRRAEKDRGDVGVRMGTGTPRICANRHESSRIGKIILAVHDHAVDECQRGRGFAGGGES